MKKYIIAAVVALTALLGARAEERSSLIVNTTAGDKVEFKFIEQPEMTFEGDDVVITDLAGTTVRYDMADVENITFSKYTDVKEVATDHVTVQVTRSLVAVSGLEAGASVAIYNVDGMALASAAAGADGTLTIPVEDFPKGVYIVVMPGHNFKFIR